MAKEKTRTNRAELRKSRAEAYFIEYYEMGPSRSLERLHERVTKMGLRKSLTSLKRYSIDFEWQKRVELLDTKFKAERELHARAKIDDMNDSQALDGRNMRSIARAAMINLSNIIRETGVLNLPAQDIVRFMAEGTKIERLAMGEVTDRIEAHDFAYNVMLLGIVEIFNEINEYPSKAKRREAFAVKVDELRDQKMLEIGVGRG